MILAQAMGKRPPAPAADSALFDMARPKGATERAVERSLALWRAGGRDLDPITSRMLRIQGHAVDLAQGKADPWQIGNANRVLLELMAGVGLVSAAAAADPVETLLAQIMADDDADDDRAAQIRNAPPA